MMPATPRPSARTSPAPPSTCSGTGESISGCPYRLDDVHTNQVLRAAGTSLFLGQHTLVSPLLAGIIMRNRSSGVLISAPRKYLSRSTYRYFSRQMAPFHSRNQAIPSDLRYLQKKDGTVIAAQEEDFYRYTTKRWLSNDTEEASQRYQRFDI
ncbi:hypothetical protein BDV35DRAFT_256437 [Aspergillus flavus]|uniref:Uncharacterized protein n=1 Tax=Aspergillus flavus TaxID=5059 RepID=A0A5N6GYF0_ASPFL|nr:hypothetical protein BDV35DRAFT_256437 [Aspergillus flavus]